MAAAAEKDRSEQFTEKTPAEQAAEAAARRERGGKVVETTDTPKGCPATKGVGKHVSVLGRDGERRAGTVISFVQWETSKQREDPKDALHWYYGQCHIKVRWEDPEEYQILDPSNVKPMAQEDFDKYLEKLKAAPAAASEPGIPPETLGAIADANRNVVAASEIASAAQTKYRGATIENKGREVRARKASNELSKRTVHMNEMMTQYSRSMRAQGNSEKVQSGFLKSVDDAIAGVKAQVAVLENEVDPPAVAGGKRRRHKTPKRRRVRKSTFRRHRKH